MQAQTSPTVVTRPAQKMKQLANTERRSAVPYCLLYLAMYKINAFYVDIHLYTDLYTHAFETPDSISFSMLFPFESPVSGQHPCIPV